MFLRSLQTFTIIRYKMYFLIFTNESHIFCLWCLPNSNLMYFLLLLIHSAVIIIYIYLFIYWGMYLRDRPFIVYLLLHKGVEWMGQENLWAIFGAVKIFSHLQWLIGRSLWHWSGTMKSLGHTNEAMKLFRRTLGATKHFLGSKSTLPPGKVVNDTFPLLLSLLDSLSTRCT